MTTFQQIDTINIVPSPKNPRKHFDQTKQDELTASIAAHGILQPITVRKAGIGMFEIVLGERRYRSALVAGLIYIPAMIVEMSDEQMLEAMMIENLQRADLHPLEEAEGYELMIKDHHYTYDTLAEKIGKSRSWIFGRLKLLALDEEAQRVFRSGGLNASTALLIARIPTQKMRAKALEDLTRKDYSGDTMSVREAQRYIRDRYMLRLSDAPFPTDDGELVAMAGPCGSCPKRTGNAPELFDDIDSADVCTDPDCFAQKKMAATERRVQQLGSDVKVITGEEATKIMPSHTSESRTHVQLDNKCYDDPDHRTYREIMGEDTQGVAMIEHGHKGDLLEVVSKKAIAEKLEAAGIITQKAKEKDASHKLAQKVILANIYRDKLFRHVRQLVAVDIKETQALVIAEIMPIIALRFLTECGFDKGGQVAGLWGALGNDNYSRFDAFKFGLPNLSLTEQFLFCLDLAIISEQRMDQYNYSKEPTILLGLAEKLAIDPEALLKEAKDEQSAAENAKKPKKSTKKTPVATPAAPLPPSTAAQAVISSAQKTEAAPAEDQRPIEEVATKVASESEEETKSKAIENEEKPTPAEPEGALESLKYPAGTWVKIKATAKNWRMAGGHAVIKDTMRPGLYKAYYGPMICDFSLIHDEDITETMPADFVAPWVPAVRVDDEEKTEVIEEEPSPAKREPARYCHPNNPELCWTGRGRKPLWVSTYLSEDGHTLQDLEQVA